MITNGFIILYSDKIFIGGILFTLYLQNFHCQVSKQYFYLLLLLTILVKIYKQTVVGWKMAFQKISTSQTMNPLWQKLRLKTKKRTFEDMIQGLKMGKLSWIIWVGPKRNHIHPYMETEGDLGHTAEKAVQRHSKERSEDSGLKDESDITVTSNHQNLEKARN